MNLKEFRDGIEILEQTWPKFYTESRVQVLSDKYSKISSRLWMEMVRHAVSTCRQPPTPNEFDIIQKNTGVVEKTKDVLRVQCTQCKSSGFIVAIHKTLNALPYVFKCSCENGDLFPNYPEFSYGAQRFFEPINDPPEPGGEVRAAS